MYLFESVSTWYIPREESSDQRAYRVLNIVPAVQERVSTLNAKHHSISVRVATFAGPTKTPYGP